jgi:hypothetical protein
MIDITVAGSAVAGAASLWACLTAVDKGIPRLTATAAAVSQGRRLGELVHLHETVPHAVRRLAGGTLDPVGRHGLRPFRVILGIDPITGQAVQGRRGISAVFFGPPGSGKTCMLAANVQAWVLAGGVAICGSEAPDVLDAVRAPCLHRGDVYAFDPLGALTQRPRAGVIPVWWSPVPGADDPGVALDRMMALTVNAGKGIEGGGGHFRDASAMLGSCLLYAAALEGLPWSTVYGWTMDFISRPKVNHVGGADKAAEIIIRHRGADDPMLKTLIGYMPWVDGPNADTRTLENILGTLRPCLKWSVKPNLCDAVDAASAQPFDMHRFLSTPHASLHIICPASDGSADAGPLVIGFIAALRKASRELAEAVDGDGHNPVPVLAALDEVANYPMPELPSILAVERKKDWTVIAVFQTIAQAMRGWDNDFGQELLTIGGAKVILPGSSEPILTAWAMGMSGTKMVDRTATNDGWSRSPQVDVNVQTHDDGRGRGADKVHGSVLPWRRWQRSMRGTQTTQHEVPRHLAHDICNLQEGTAWVKDGHNPARILGQPLHHSVQPFKTWSAVEEPAGIQEHLRVFDAMRAQQALPPPVVHHEPQEEPVAPAAAGGGTIVPIATLRDQRDHRDDGTAAAGNEGA